MPSAKTNTPGDIAIVVSQINSFSNRPPVRLGGNAQDSN